MLKFLKYLFTGTKPIDEDGHELILGKPEDDKGFNEFLDEVAKAERADAELTDNDFPTPAVPDAEITAGDGGTVKAEVNEEGYVETAEERSRRRKRERDRRYKAKKKAKTTVGLVDAYA